MRHTDHVIPDRPRPLPDGPLYFVGVGGAGMSAIAQVLAERGHAVSGADPGISPTVRARLEKAGVTVFTAHDAANLPEGVAAVVVSDAIPQNNPEVNAARERGLPIVRRPEALGALMAQGRGIAIAGTHGKTTTTGMVASILMAAGLDPTVLIGGDLPLIGGNARAGKGDIVLAESCEAYDGFLYLHPEIAVILNVEADHLDYHGTEEHVFQSFRRFLGQVAPNGTVILNADDPHAFAFYEDADARGRVTGYTTDPECPAIGMGVDIWASAVRATPEGMAFVLSDESGTSRRVQLRVPGRHNCSNALAAASAALAAGVSLDAIVAGLEAFTGTGRRFERIGEANGVLVVDDYAHHPTEIRATLAAARSAYPERRLVAVFQPHLYSRTRDNMEEFATELGAADVVYLTDIYRAREEPIPGISSETLAERARAKTPGLDVVYVPEKSDLPARLAEAVRPGDIVLTLGAGDIRAAGEGLLKIWTN